MSMGSEARGGPAEVQLPAHLLKGRSFLRRQNLGGRVCGCSWVLGSGPLSPLQYPLSRLLQLSRKRQHCVERVLPPLAKWVV